MKTKFVPCVQVNRFPNKEGCFIVQTQYTNNGLVFTNDNNGFGYSNDEALDLATRIRADLNKNAYNPKF